MSRTAKPAALVLMLAILLSLSGCYTGAIEQYFCLPKPTEEYLQLQCLIDEELSAGSEYAPPAGGRYRQSVQLADLNGDGQDEALAFFRAPGENLKICIYAHAPQEREYRLSLSIQGDGSSIGSVEYADVNGDGWLELLVTWQLGGGMRVLSVYDLASWNENVLITSDCQEFLVSDMDEDGQSDILVLRSTGPGALCADLYTFSYPAVQPSVTSDLLSPDITALRRVRAAAITGGVPAVLVESVCDNGDLVSDLFVCRSGSLVNITPDGETRRAFSAAAAQDINGDRYLEIPHPSQLFTQSGDGPHWSLAWYGYDRNGNTYKRLITYHCYADGWYLILPAGWENGLTVRRDDSVTGERAVTLSRVSADGSINDLLTLYTLTGESREERAQIAGRFFLQENETTVYAAKITAGITEEEVRESFKIIYAEWGTGSV